MLFIIQNRDGFPTIFRWKLIPLLFDEQLFGLKIIEDSNFQRPLIKTMRKHFGKGVNLYAGRKAFTDLMMFRGHLFEKITYYGSIGGPCEGFKSITGCCNAR